jgi:hydroxymethylpyrimidine/phosphomethylpyrimidine kinase
MGKIRPLVLSIAGLDPSGGAGLLADVKTFEANKVYGFGIASANTFQNDIEFEKVEWIKPEIIIEQFEILQRRFKIDFVKVGLIENFEILFGLVAALKRKNAETKIIWDPILKASAGLEFHKRPDQKLLENICKEIHLITPNVPESKKLGSSEDPAENARTLSKFCNVFLKGGHDEKNKGRDFLFIKEGKEFSFKPKTKEKVEKHGSGCVLSSAITANLAKGFKIHPACLRAKDYTTGFLLSNKSLLGYHTV